MKNKNITKLLLTISLFIFIFGAGYKIGEYKALTNTTAQGQIKNLDFNLFWQTWDQLEQKYVDKTKIDSTKMFYGAIKGMVASLGDPYTFFLTPEENKDSKADLEGKFTGIGAQLGLKNNQIIIIAPLKDSPAIKAGVKSGDIIKGVDGQSTEGWTLIEAVSKIRGEEGTDVILTLEGQDEVERKVTITRAEIKVESVEYRLEDATECTSDCEQVAYVKINQFGENTNQEWDKAVDFVLQNINQGNINSMVLDLRDNPGGFLESSVYIASEFIEKGLLVVKQESTVGTNKDYLSTRNGKLQDINLVVLINEGSASASEILAGALKDYDKATLVGVKTFGKGSVQEALDLRKGAGLHVTVAKWILPNGEWINGKGIAPDTELELVLEDGNTLTREQDQQLEMAIEMLIK
ncbi:MAG: S41 family peptidase [Patescibacteria group bacterium]